MRRGIIQGANSWASQLANNSDEVDPGMGPSFQPSFGLGMAESSVGGMGGYMLRAGTI